MFHAFGVSRGFRRSLGAVFSVAVLLTATSLHAEELTLKRVVLSSGGLGYFEYEAEIEGDAKLKLTVGLDQVDDVLKSLVVYDDKGGVGGLDLPSREPLAAAFRDLPFGAEDLASSEALLKSLRGAEIVVTGARTLIGRVVAVTDEPQVSPEGRQIGGRHRVTLMSDKGLRNFVLEDAESVTFVDPALQAQIDRALGALEDNHEKDSRTLQLTSNGRDKRKVRVAYLVQAPIWKASYRLVLPEDASAGSAKLQGWATMENLSGQDWRDVDLTLVSGQPVTFRQQLYRAYMVDRPEAPVEVVGRLLPNLDEGGVAQSTTEAPKVIRGMGPDTLANLKVDQSWGSAQLSGALDRVHADLAESASTVVAQEGLTQVVFHLPSSVSVEKGRTLSIPIIDEAAPVERLAYYQPDVSTTHPLSTLKLTNDAKTGLPPGIVTIYEQQADGVAFVGDSRLSDLPRGDFRLLSYALDSKMTIEHSDDQSSRLVRGAIAKGVLTIETLRSHKTIFHVKSLEKRQLIVEMAKQDDWTLAEPSPDGVSEAKGQYRIPFQVEVADGQTFAVTQQHSEVQALTLSAADDASVGYYVKAPELDRKTRDLLMRLAELRARAG